MQVTIIGGGIIGLCTAYYLEQAGHDVTVIEQNDISGGCSFGNMGYISPSHFIPIATPGIVAQGLRWMLSSSSPFYIKPRLNRDLIRWGMLFRKQARSSVLERNIPHLNNLLQLSRALMNDINRDFPGSFDMTEKGCWMLYKNEKTGDHEKRLSAQAEKLGLRTVICNREQVQSYETETEVDVLGGVLYLDDCHIDSTKFMRTMYEHLLRKKVKFWLHTSVTGFATQFNRVEYVKSDKADIPCEHLVLANGSWMGEAAGKLGIRLPIQPGKGYSVDYFNNEKNLQFPSILVDHRTATTPIGKKLRIGGTMELSGHNDRILPKRVMAIYEAFKKYYPQMDIPRPDPSQAWFGYRPVSPDGMPYIGPHPKWQNLVFAGGHAMLGVSAAAGTGKLVKEIVGRENPSIEIQAFDPQRFS
jgi:D-amino-acid dehydrogenase